MSADSDEEDLIALNFLNLRNGAKKPKKRKFWVHPLWQLNPRYGVFKVFRELNLDDSKFLTIYRMKKSTFKILLEKLRVSIQKQDTHFRLAISPAEGLLITLRYYATGCNLKALSCYFLRGHTSVRRIVEETSEAIWRVLQPEYLPAPNTERWKQVAERYWELWNMPNCLGSIDGKHIRIKNPARAGSQFINYKGFFSVVLMAVADADGLFVSVDVGEYGRNSDGRAFKESAFGKALKNGQLSLPNPVPLPGQEDPFSYFFVGDEAFPLTEHVMRPFPQRTLNNKRRVFNGRLSRARKSVECSFGIMASKFRILRTAIELKMETVDNIVLSLCALHNMIRIHEGKFSKPSFQEAVADDMNVGDGNIISSQRRASNPAIAMRERLADFFLTPEGAIGEQRRFCV